MDILTKELCGKIPHIYSNEKKKPEDIKVIIKFFTPWSHWYWYATKAEGIGADYESVSLTSDTNLEDLLDVRFFGFVAGDFPELGYFSLEELKALNGPYGLKIERDIHFGFEHTLKEVMDKHKE